jgi:hypothetical protein
MVLNVCFDVSSDNMWDRQGKREKADRLDILPRTFLLKLSKTAQDVSIASVPAEIRTQHLLNVSHESYSYTKVLGGRSSREEGFEGKIGAQEWGLLWKTHKIDALAGTEEQQLRELDAYGRPSIRRTASASTERLNPLRRRSCRSQGVIPCPISGRIYGRDVNCISSYTADLMEYSLRN